MPPNPKITVVIPTRERGDVLRRCLQTVTAQDYDNLEVLVSDNASTDGTEQIARSTGDPRVKYVNTGRRMSMSHNWEFALSHVTDGWVMIMGDDDGLLPNILNKIADIIRATGTSAIIPNCCTYIWPNEGNDHRGRLLVPMARGYEVRNSRQWLRRVLEGRAWYSELPMLYAGGIMKMALINSVKERKGTFFQSCQPDIFSSIAFASSTNNYVYSHEPFALAGHSRHSNGASWSASGKANTSAEKLAPIKRFLSEGNIPFHPGVPLLPDGTFPVSVNVLVYESYLQASYIHNNELGITPESQLAVFLSAKVDDKQMQDWIRIFAKHHGLSIEDTRTFKTRALIRLEKLREYAWAFLKYYRIEPSFGLRIRDVFEGSIVADTVLRLRPSRLRSYLNTLQKWSGKASLRLSAR